jgi:hypothetical protein
MEGDEGMHEHKPAASLKREGKGQRPSKEQIIELVDDFALHMKHKMLANAHKGGWRGEQLSYVFTRLLQEVSELSEAIVQCQTPDEDGATEENVIRVAGEAADVANFAMMVYDLVKAEFEKRPLR